MTNPPEPSRLQLPPRFLVILFAPVAVFLLLEFVLKSLGDPHLALPLDALLDEAPLAELTGRYKFLAAFAFFGAVSVAVLAIFGFDLRSNYTRRTAIRCLAAVVAAAAVGLVYSVVEPDALGGFELRDLLGRGFFDSAVGRGGVGLCADGTACSEAGGLFVLRAITGPINGLTSFALAAAMIGLILALARRNGAVPFAETDHIASDVADLTTGRAVSQRYLYCAGLLLTSGITFLIAWMRWPTDLIADAAMRQQYLDLTAAISLYVGVGYSVLILSAYLPVILLLTRRAEALRNKLAARQAIDRSENAGAPELAIDLPALNYLDALKSVAAILSPVLASSIGTFGQGAIFG